MQVISLDHLVLTVADPTRTAAFYSDLLGMELIRFNAAEATPRLALRFGAQKINLHVAGAEFEPKANRPTPGSADLCFLVDGPLEDWVARLEAAGIAIEQSPVRRTGATSALMSIYVRDPDANLIELSVPGL